MHAAGCYLIWVSGDDRAVCIRLCRCNFVSLRWYRCPRAQPIRGCSHFGVLLVRDSRLLEDDTHFAGSLDRSRSVYGLASLEPARHMDRSRLEARIGGSGAATSHGRHVCGTVCRSLACMDLAEDEDPLLHLCVRNAGARYSRNDLHSAERYSLKTTSQCKTY